MNNPPTRLRIEHEPRSLGVGVARPRLSWQLPDGAPAQFGYRVDAEIDGTVLSHHTADSDSPLLRPWPFGDLRSRQQVSWRVQVHTDRGWSTWSPRHRFEMGLLRPGDWRGRFVTAGDPTPLPARGDRGARYLRRRFRVDRTPAAARVYATAHGLYELHLDGLRIGDLELTPGFRSYHTHLDVQTYDITDLLSPGDHELSATVSDGWWRGGTGFFHLDKIYGDTTSLLAQLELADSDGTRVVIGTDDTWEAAVHGRITAADLMAGQRSDLRLPEIPDAGWTSATAVAETAPRPGVHTLALICELSEPAPGLIAWLTVHHHDASVGVHWRRGVFLRHPIEAYRSEALIELPSRHQDLRLLIEVRAPAPELFFNVLRDSLEKLLTTRWPGLRYVLRVPCPHRDDTDGRRCSGLFSLTSLIRDREEHRATCRCNDCGTEHSLFELLTGFSPAPAPLQPHLDEVLDQLRRIDRGVRQVQYTAAATALWIRTVQRSVGIEVADCPRLFTITRQSQGWRQLKFYERQYELMLWCEHPGAEHPLPQAHYRLGHRKEWARKIGPYVSLMFKALQLVVPLVVDVAELAEWQLELSQRQFKLMRPVVRGLPIKGDGHADHLLRSRDSGLTLAEGESLRAFRALLFELDPSHVFGGLRRVVAPDGQFLWVCPEHYRPYDPGIPHIPADPTPQPQIETTPGDPEPQTA